MNLADVVSTFRAALAALCCARWIYMESTLLCGADPTSCRMLPVTIR